MKTMLHKDLLTDRTLKVRRSREAHFCRRPACWSDEVILAPNGQLHWASESSPDDPNVCVRHAQALWDVAAGRDDADHTTIAQVGVSRCRDCASRPRMLNEGPIVPTNASSLPWQVFVDASREWTMTASRVLMCRSGAPGLRWRSSAWSLPSGPTPCSTTWTHCCRQGVTNCMLDAEALACLYVLAAHLQGHSGAPRVPSADARTRPC